MSLFVRTQSQSSDKTAQSPFKLNSLLHKLALKILRSSKNVLNLQLTKNLQQRYQQFVVKDEKVVDFFQYLIYAFLNQIDALRRTQKMEIVQKDYQILEQAVQKAQAEIRNHIRIEQQLKIYLDGLQQKSDEFKIRLELEQNRYNKLSQCMKQIQGQRKQLLKKLMKLEEGQVSKLPSKEKYNFSSHFKTINDQLYKEYTGSRITKANKGKNAIDKLNIRKFSDKKSPSHLKIIDGQIKINLSNNVAMGKKGSYDQYIAKGEGATHNASIGQLTKTVQMKQLNAGHIERRPKRKVSKYKTQSGEPHYKKEQRSNSVCN